MHLVYALAAGVASAPNGTAEVRHRGASAFAQYYLDFKGTVPVAAGTPVALNGDGAAVIYVDALCDVVVKDQGGSAVRAFCSASALGAIEVISSAFTGVDYDGGQTGLSKPRTLQYVMDLWKVVNGAPDWKVRINGSDVPIPEALGNGGECFSVRNEAYGGGAQGDGVTDDLTPFLLAIAAAAANAGGEGGVVCIPPGTYAISETLTIPQNVSLRGAGSSVSKLVFGVVTGDGALVFPGSSTPDRQFCEGLSLDYSEDESNRALVRGTDCWLDCRDLVLNADQNSVSSWLVRFADTTTFFRADFDRCVFFLRSTTSSADNGIRSAIAPEMSDCTVRNSRFVLAAGYGGYAIRTEGIKAFGNTFDCSAVTSQPMSSAVLVDADAGGLVCNNDIIEPTQEPVALISFLRTPDVGSEYVLAEWGNRLGSGEFPTVFTLYDAQQTEATLGTRLGRYLVVEGDDDASFTANFKEYARVHNLREAGGNQTISFTMGPVGTRGVLTVDPQADFILYWGPNIQPLHAFEQLEEDEIRAFEFEFFEDSGTVFAKEVGNACCYLWELSQAQEGIDEATVNHDYDIAAIWTTMPSAMGIVELEVETFHVSRIGTVSCQSTRNLVLLRCDSNALTSIEVQDQYANADAYGDVTISLDSGNLRVSMTSGESDNIECAKSRVCCKRACFA